MTKRGRAAREIREYVTEEEYDKPGADGGTTKAWRCVCITPPRSPKGYDIDTHGPLICTGLTTGSIACEDSAESRPICAEGFSQLTRTVVPSSEELEQLGEGVEPVPETELVPISYTCDRMYAPLAMHGCEMNYFPAPLQHPLQFCGEVPGDDVTDEAGGQAAVQGEAQEVRVLLLTAACC